MQAEIIAVGTELLGPDRLDTNSLFLTGELHALGILVGQKTVVGDDVQAIAAAVRAALARAQVVLLSGGLGPTQDDRTREAVAAALGRGLRPVPALEAALRQYFAARHRPMPANNLQQAELIAGAEALPNPLGSAPGQWVDTGTAVLVLLPGPPRELEPMFLQTVRPRLARLSPGRVYRTSTLAIAGRSEAEVDALAAPLYLDAEGVATTILATSGLVVELHFRGEAGTETEARARARAVADAVASKLGNAVFSRCGASLAAVVGGLLRARALTLAVAESCTAGLLGAALTDAAAASDYFLGGVLCYSNQLKHDLVGVPWRLLDHHGAVSAPVAAALAEGVLTRARAHIGLSITGIAGPGGGSWTKPVGTVFIALAQAHRPTFTAHLQLAGDRDRIRRWSVAQALDLARLMMTTNI